MRWWSGQEPGCGVCAAARSRCEGRDTGVRSPTIDANGLRSVMARVHADARGDAGLHHRLCHHDPRRGIYLAPFSSPPFSPFPSPLPPVSSRPFARSRATVRRRPSRRVIKSYLPHFKSLGSPRSLTSLNWSFVSSRSSGLDAWALSTTRFVLMYP